MSAAPLEPILVVEDKPHVLALLATALTAVGLGAYDTATGGAEALRCLQGRRYALVLCERFMQPISGIDLKTLMNARREWAGIPFVCLLSAQRDGDAAKRAAAGVRHCIGFPPAPDDVLKAVAAARRENALP